MPGSEEVSTMETELTLGLPGGDIFWQESGVKRGSEEDIDEQVEDSSGPPSKVQLVGWPPVRTSRKNSMKSCKYVKVAVDGAPFLRKVDLQLYNTYQHLFKALHHMFSCFTIRDLFNDGKLMNPVNGSEYVPTYEDKDGDWMMVGDTPWKMFIESCKRIRLRRARRLSD